jgi:hypothetical protein
MGGMANFRCRMIRNWSGTASVSRKTKLPVLMRAAEDLEVSRHDCDVSRSWKGCAQLQSLEVTTSMRHLEDLTNISAFA